MKKNTGIFWWIARMAVGVFFAYAGFTKLIEPAANFEVMLLKYAVFPPAMIPILSRVLPWLEWILGSFLIVGYAPRFTVRALALLSVGFLIVLGASGLFLSSGGSRCGCFGQFGPSFSVRQIFMIDFLSLAILIRLAFFKEWPFSLDAWLVKVRR